MCQFCRRAFTLGDMWFAKEYCGKWFHDDCFDKLRVVARRTGGLL